MKYIVGIMFLILAMGCSEEVIVEEPKEIQEVVREIGKLDPIQQEVLDFTKIFLMSINYGKIDGVESLPDENSFRLVGLVVDQNTYIARVEFILRTWRGPEYPLFTIILEKSDGAFRVISTVKDR